MANDLISIKTRQVFREQMVGWVLREISDEFDAARIDCDLSYQPPVSGQRRSFIEQYYHSIDWANWGHVKKVLQVFEAVLQQAEQLAAHPDDRWQKHRKAAVDKLLWCLRKDGFEWRDERIVYSNEMPLLSEVKAVASGFDAKYMHDQIHRMESSVETDPSLAIGTAKELIETVCKTILAERGKPIAGTPDMTTLTKETLKALKLVPEGIPEAARGGEVIKRLLNNLGTIGNGLAELRGLYGTGHGKHGSSTGLSSRHAKLAVGAAVTLTVFLFETHKETKT